MSNLNLSHSCGHDNFSTVTLKYIASEISECVTLIINQSITRGIFPDHLKIAILFPYLRMMIKHKLRIIDQFLFCL